MDRYIARVVTVPLVVTLVLAALLLLIDRMRRLIDFIVDQGGPVSLVWRMLANTVPGYVSVGTAMGLLLGVLLAFRRLALSSELDVLRGAGVSYRRMLRVPNLYAVGLAIANLWVIGFVQPHARYAYDGLAYQMRSGALGASIRVGDFTRLGKLTLWAERADRRASGLDGVFVHVERRDGRDIAIAARRGRFLAADDPDTILLRLQDGTLVVQPPDARPPRTLTFASHDLPITLPAIGRFKQRGSDTAQELTLTELAALGHSPAASERQRSEARAEFHFRLTQVALMLLLPWFGLALAVPPKRSSSALGVVVAIVGVVTWYKLTQFAAGRAASGGIDAIVALWLPLLLFAALTWWIYDRAANRPGGQPIALLTAGVAKAAAWYGDTRTRQSRRRQ